MMRRQASRVRSYWKNFSVRNFQLLRPKSQQSFIATKRMKVIIVSKDYFTKRHSLKYYLGKLDSTGRRLVARMYSASGASGAGRRSGIGFTL